MKNCQKIKDQLWIQHKGKIYAVSTKAKSAGLQEESEASTLAAPFSCKVLKLHVKPGQKIKKGDPVIVVEAMKMEYSYASPKAGEIKDVLVKEGSVISQGAQFVSWK